MAQNALSGHSERLFIQKIAKNFQILAKQTKTGRPVRATR